MNRRVRLVVGWIFALSAVMVYGQAIAAAPATPSNGFGDDPEDAYLSPSRYTNAYFGFAFDLPDAAALKPMPMPASMDRRIQLLEMAASAAEHGAITLCAYEYKNKNYTNAKTLLRNQLDQELFVGVEELHGIGKTSVGGRPFYYYETRRGIDQHIVLASEMDGYVLTADLRGRDPKLVHELLAAFSKSEFFPAQEAQKRAGSQAEVYQGPAISAQHLRDVRESPPAEHIDPGKVAGNVYTNGQIGMTYQFPSGWSVEPQGAVEPAVEHYREKVSGEPLLGPRERAVVKACRRTLLSVWRNKPQADGEVPYDDFGEVTLSTMPLSCFPNIRFPEDPRDPAAVRRFVQGLSFTLPLQRDMNVARTYEVGGKTFVMTHGTIAYKAENEGLSRRISVALAMTEQRGYLLIWLLAAPHDAELRELLQAKVGFAPSAKSVNSPVSGMAGQDDPPKPESSLQGDTPSATDSNPKPAADSEQSESPSQAGASTQAATGVQPPVQTKPSLQPPPH